MGVFKGASRLLRRGKGMEEKVKPHVRLAVLK